MTERRPNLLINEKSPYLQEHAFNPVDWRPWGETALKKARNDGKPIFLSIGYSTCHWCHQFASESFEDEATAAIINKNFVAIKVDREERPEIDAYYMRAVQAMTGGGGWPLTVFLTPDLKPFYGGTYYPPLPREGLPSFKQVLEFVAKIWKDRRNEIVANSEQVAKSVSGELQRRKEADLGKGILDEGYASLVSSFDREHGGFGGSPKFPLPLASSFLLRYHFRTGKELALRSVSKTLDEMMAGGIRDHVGGGFHRYAVDRIWLVPHFEKMLYDNALLAKLYTEAYQATKNEGYANVVKETLDWILNEMRDAGGGFYSAEDADTKDGEGVYYTWTPDEVKGVLGTADGSEFCRMFGVTNVGNFEGRSILHLDPGRPHPAVGNPSVIGWKSKLYAQRLKRNRPAADAKVLTSWNGLAISAFAFAGRVLENQKYLDAAIMAAEFVLKNNTREGRLLRRYAGGEAALEGTLEDYAFLVAGLLDLFEASSEARWLREAVRLTEIMVNDLEDKDKGAFFLTAKSELAKLKEGYDGVTPSGNSVAAVNLIRLAELTGREEFRKTAERVLGFFSADIEQQPSGQANMLIALDMLQNGVMEVVITSSKASATAVMVKEAFREFIPNKVVLVATTENYPELSKLTSLLDGRKPAAKARAYVCVNFTCKLPADDAATLRTQMAPAKASV